MAAQGLLPKPCTKIIKQSMENHSSQTIQRKYQSHFLYTETIRQTPLMPAQ
jgi:hypothetical protein